MTAFFQLTLRTLDVEAARSFYTSLLGGGPLEIVQLHEQAVARGARPHWLGFLEVGDVDQAAADFVRRGASPLAPKWRTAAGVEAAVMRDPGGAILALAKPPSREYAARRSREPEVVWYELNTSEVGRAKVHYSELFGWAIEEPTEQGGLAVVHPFAWQPGGRQVGSMAAIEGRAGVHAHWLFHFRVDSLARAAQVVRDAGGVAFDPMTLSNGDQLAVCDDPQGAAFVIRQPGRAASLP
jgi:uncharacterized protein